MFLGEIGEPFHIKGHPDDIAGKVMALQSFGKFDQNLGLQGTNTNNIPFGSLNRESWDSKDSDMLLLNYQLGKQFNFYNQYLLIDLDLSGENNFILNDLSGNPNELELIGDYLLEFDSL